jgi:hypothetical protein
VKQKIFINFTKATLMNLPIPQKELLTFSDTQEKGFQLMCDSQRSPELSGAEAYK